MTTILQTTTVKPLDPTALFDGGRILVLGGTGFLGKVFWAMLLDRYPNLGKIYLLVRASGEVTSEQRFWQSVAVSECLEPLRQTHVGAAFEAFLHEKIVPINGDVGRPLCGIDPDLVKELRGTIAAVVNVAGVVDFNPPLDEALSANAFGAQNLVALTRALGDAVPLMHTSTCYVAGRRRGVILETNPCDFPFPRAAELGRELWDPEREISECLELVSQAQHRANDAFRQSEFAEQARKNLAGRGEPSEGEPFDDEFSRVKRKFVSANLVEAGLDRALHWGWPNIYTYTKSIGEQVIARSNLPFTIVRPACCETASHFPFPRWNEGIGTSAPIIFLSMQGQQNWPAARVALDFIPADLVTAGMIMSLAELIEGTHKPVYQYGASDVNPCTAARFGELIGLYKRKHWRNKAGGNPIVNTLQQYFEPTYLSPKAYDMFGSPGIARAAKGLSGLLRKAGVPMLKPAARVLDGVHEQQKKIGEVMNLFAPFTSEANGPFDCSNTRAAHARLSPEDKVKLRWDPETIDWMDWTLDVHMPGIEKWVLPGMEQRLTKREKPRRAHATLLTMLDQMADRHEHALALQRFEDDGFSRITYRDVQKRAGAVAARLQAHGIVKGDRVLLSAKSRPEWPIAYFGILRAGATVVPVDAALDFVALANVVRESGAKLAISDRALETEIGLATWDLVVATTEDASLVAAAVDVAPQDVASLIYTSGTTGVPKGVMLTHANFTSLVAALAPIFPLKEGERVLSVLPLHHTFEFTCGLLLPFTRGARVAYLDELTGERLAAGMRAGRVTAMVGVPALWQLLERRILAEVKAKGPAAESVFHWASTFNRMLGKQLGVDAGKFLFGPVHKALGGEVKYLISGGAALPRETQKLFAGLGLHLTEGYGLTEAAPVLTVSKPSPRSPAGQVGKPIPGVSIRIDAPDEHGVGEIHAKGPNVMAGYTDAEATAEVMTETGWLRTGDLGKLDASGRLQIVGRSKDVIVTATGENVYPDDIEHRLGKIAGVAELAIVGIDGAGGERVGCLAVPDADDDVTRAERNDRAMRALRQAISHLAYGQQPSVVHLYEASLPRTATRKVKRNDVRAILTRMVAATAAPEGDAVESSLVRRAVAALSGRSIAEVHGQLSLQGDLGFDSLMLTELLEALEAKGDAIDPHALQACRTIDEVEALAGERAVHGTPSRRGLSRTKQIEGETSPDLVLPPEVQDSAKAIIGKFQDMFYGQVMKSRVSGRGFIPHNRNTIVVANHGSHLDMGFVRHALGTYGEDLVSLAAQDYFFQSGVKRAFFENLTNLKALDRKGGVRASLRQAGEVLESGKTVLLFPEGTRSVTGEITEFKPFVGYLALSHGIDILPVYLAGTQSAMPKGAVLPTNREISARIGLPFSVVDMRRLTRGMTTQDAAREVARLSREAVLALRDGEVLDFSKLKVGEVAAVREHPLVGVFAELGEKFRPNQVEKSVSFYFTLGGDPFAKWTVTIDPASCQIKRGKPEGFDADCVLKTSAEIFTKIVRESFVPGPADFLSGAVKSNDVMLLQTFQKAFQLDS